MVKTAKKFAGFKFFIIPVEKIHIFNKKVGDFWLFSVFALYL